MHHCDTLFVHCDSSITVRKRVASGERKEKFVLPRAFVISKEYCMTQLLSTARPLPSFRGRKNPTPPLKRYENEDSNYPRVERKPNANCKYYVRHLGWKKKKSSVKYW